MDLFKNFYSKQANVPAWLVATWNGSKEFSKRNWKTVVPAIGTIILLAALVVGDHVARHHNQLEQEAKTLQQQQAEQSARNAEVVRQRQVEVAAAAERATNQPHPYTIHDGDTLWWIANDACSNPMRWSEITFADGSVISNPKKIRKPEQVLIPANCNVPVDFTPHRITWAPRSTVVAVDTNGCDQQPEEVPPTRQDSEFPASKPEVVPSETPQVIPTVTDPNIKANPPPAATPTPVVTSTPLASPTATTVQSPITVTAPAPISAKATKVKVAKIAGYSFTIGEDLQGKLQTQLLTFDSETERQAGVNSSRIPLHDSRAMAAKDGGSIIYVHLTQLPTKLYALRVAGINRNIESDELKAFTGKFPGNHKGLMFLGATANPAATIGLTLLASSNPVTAAIAGSVSVAPLVVNLIREKHDASVERKLTALQAVVDARRLDVYRKQLALQGALTESRTLSSKEEAQ
jgi:hypothetical protein